ncbi:hypothetical protein [Flavobacterium sp.]|uniref:hypothetical protein n=1 Tax=Flavobacterium sp. TaxID=239 RepID=UPI0008AF9F7C|nr:hypothetical protein [Flavobacterium sp.]OGS64098.1 MAG: hypothetical protein A2X21_08010 [Flavobacteria bacterium GWA2_35_26]HCF02738.1 hypothetical protein [Flavobacterium sp.]
MKNLVTIVLFSFLLVGCKQQIQSTDIPNINGYWEIEKVVFDEGEDKEYGANQNYDYFQIDKNNQGIRKKVAPQLDGTFLVDDSFEKVRVRFQDDKAFLDYVTPYMKYTEEIIALTADELVVLNAQKTEYHYKKATAINILGDGKKTK